MQLTQQPKITQSLVMTAQLQQAIRILQLSASELAEEIERAFLENPLLEMEEGDSASAQDAPAHDEERTCIEDACAGHPQSQSAQSAALSCRQLCGTARKPP